jgi:hypothetical protein
MANQRSVSLDELSERLTIAVTNNLTSFMDLETIATAALAHISSQSIVASDTDIAEEDLGLLGFAIQDGMSSAVFEDRIERAITRSLKDAGVTNEPAMDVPAIRQQIGEAVNANVNTAMAYSRPQPSVLSMDVTALREQILSSFYQPQVHNPSHLYSSTDKQIVPQPTAESSTTCTMILCQKTCSHRDPHHF